MNAPVTNMPDIELSEEVLGDVEALANKITHDEAIWISGYFAGLARNRVSEEQEKNGIPHAATSPGRTDKQQQDVCVLFATETGNSKELAEQLTQQLSDCGYHVRCSDAAEYKIQHLRKETCLLVISSTHGDGDPPETAKPFFEALQGRKAPELKQLSYAVLGLGDTSYEYFCAAARMLDERLADLGATALAERVECDVDYDEPAANWIEKIKQILLERIPVESAMTVADVVTGPENEAVVAREKKYDRRHPFIATVLENQGITGRGSSKEIRHIELSLSDSGLEYQPGDALRVLPVNMPDVVDEILDVMRFTGQEKINGESLSDSLLREYEITTLTPRFIESWALLSDADELKALPSQGRETLFKYMSSAQIIDVIKQYPAHGIEPVDFLQGLRKLQPRLYSISSSMEQVYDEVHITVARLDYMLNGSMRYGVASNYLSDQAAVDSSIPVYIHQNNNFRLPDDSSIPIIMIGAGTGIAPYRAFLQQIEAREQTSTAAWLFFGERNFRTDFLYQSEWQHWLHNNFLQRISLAFSRDQKQKVYVQHRLLENARLVYRWIEEGAVVYVCGDASQMAVDVDNTLLTIIKNEAGINDDVAREKLNQMIADRRYLKDVY